MKNNGLVARIVLIGISIMCMGFSAKVYSLVENVGQSEIILIGDVKIVKDGYVVMAVSKVIKGAVPLKEIEVAWNSKPGIEKIVPQYVAGDQYLLFTNNSDTRYDPFGGGQGVTKLGKGDAEIYEDAINVISNYNAAKSQEEIKGALFAMFKSNNRLLQDVALRLIYTDGDFRIRKAEISGDDFKQDIIKLTGSPDRNTAIAATRLLSRGGIYSIPKLIELVGNNDETISAIATRSLINKTGFSNNFKKGDSVAERQENKAKWEEWWWKNKSTVKLRP